MKKTVFALLLVAVLLVGVVALSAFPAEAENVGPIRHCLCGKTEQGHCSICDSDAQEWNPWTATDSLPTSGYYYLTADVTLDDTNNVITGATLYLDFHGQAVRHPLNGGSRVARFDGSKVVLTDSAGTGGIIGEMAEGVASTSAQGAILWLREGTMLTMYGGTLDGTNMVATNYGGAVGVETGTEFTMYGGAIIGNTNGNGGAIGGAGTVNLYKGATITGTAKGRGGAIYMTGGVVTIDGATVKGTANRAGAVGVYGGTLNIKAGTVDGKGTLSGSEGNNGGAIFQTTGTINISGGEVTGVAGNMGGAVASGGGTIKFSGGTVKDCYGPGGGGAFYLAGGKLYMSGNATIENCKTDNNTSHFGGAINMSSNTNNVFEMTGDAKITGCYAGKGGAIYANTRPIKITDNASIDGTAMDQGGAMLVQGAMTVEISGNAKVHGEITTTSTGNDFGGGAISLFNGAPQVTISGYAEVSGKGSKGGAFYIRQDTGKITVKDNATITGEATGNGGVLYIRGSGTFTMEDGTIKDSKASRGGAMAMESGIVHLNGGTIQNCEAQFGGALYVAGGTTNLNGTNIEECSATSNAGAVYATAGTFNIKKGTISGGHADNLGGSLGVDGGTVDISGGAITGGSAKTEDSANVFHLKGTVTMSGGTIEGGYLLSTANRGNDNEPMLTLSSTAVIASEENTGLTSYADAKVAVNALETGAKINVTMERANLDSLNGQVFATGTAADAGYITYDGTNIHPEYRDGKLVWNGVAARIGSAIYASLQEAVDAYEDGTIQLLDDVVGDLVLTYETYLDLNGMTLTGNVSGEKLRGIDTASTTSGDGKNVGHIYGDIGNNVADAAEANGAVYVHVVEGDNVHSFHKIDLKVTSVTLRPCFFLDEEDPDTMQPALYYKSTIVADDLAVANSDQWLGSYGSAFTTNADAGNSLKDYRCATFEGYADSVYGSLIYGMLTLDGKDDSDVDLYSRTFMTTEDGDVFFGKTVSRTLQEVVQAAFKMWGDLDNTKRVYLATMYDTYSSVMSSWELENTDFPGIDWDI